MTPDRRLIPLVKSSTLSGLCVALSFFALTAIAADGAEIRVAYLVETRIRPPVLSNLDEPPADAGVAGAELGAADNNTTGRFTGQRFALQLHRLDAGADPASLLENIAADGVELILLDLEAATLGRLLQQALPENLLMFNVATQDRDFRDSACHPAVLHTALSRDMRSDALAQFLIKKRWKNWFLVTGPRTEDKLFAAAVERSARKFGAEIIARKNWSGDFDARRSAPAEVALFTQGIDYDVLIVADEIGDFGDYLMFNTWDPRPLAGTQGLMPISWGRPVEQWGAAQLQERFLAHSGRWMLPRDYAAWAAMRSIGEGALRSRSESHDKIAAYLRSSKFQLGGFKGRKLSFREWNGQMRQPVPLIWARALVALAPLEGFLHQHSELDTLGLDRPESKCKLN